MIRRDMFVYDLDMCSIGSCSLSLCPWCTQREAAEIAALVEQQRIARLPTGELHHPVTSHADHVRGLTFGGGVVGTLTGHDGPVNCIATLRDGRLVSGSDDATVRANACHALLKGIYHWRYFLYNVPFSIARQPRMEHD